MNKQDIWRLTVCFWPAAAEAGVAPCVATSYTQEGPQFYRPHDFDFTRPPSHEDFLAVVNQTPWMRGWEQDLLPVIAKNNWPVVEPCHKAAHEELKTKGKIVGELRIRRQTLYVNIADHPSV